MFRLRSIAAAIAIGALAFSTAAAQRAACGARTTLTVAAGVARSDRVDATASAAQFGGRGTDFSGNIEHATGGVCLVGDVRGGAKALAATQGSTASERLIDADAGLAALHAVGSRSSDRYSFAVGAELRGSIASTEHAYADPRHSISHFRLGVISVGPAALARVRLGPGSATAQLSAPVASFVDHPYTAVWSGDAGPRFRFASPADLRGATSSVSYTLESRGALMATIAYRVTALRYDDVLPVRTLTQSISVGAGVRLSSRR